MLFGSKMVNGLQLISPQRRINANLPLIKGMVEVNSSLAFV
jgi:hypothetical protein